MDINPDSTWEDLPPEAQKLYGNDPDNWAAAKEQMADFTMAMSLEARVVGTDDLKTICRVADEMDLNRQITEEAVANLQPDSNHLLKPVLIHRWANMEPAPVHMRCHVYLGMSDNPKEPVEAMMDVPMELFVQLDTYSNMMGESAVVKDLGDFERFVQDFQAHVGGSKEVSPGDDFPSL